MTLLQLYRIFVDDEAYACTRFSLLGSDPFCSRCTCCTVLIFCTYYSSAFVLERQDRWMMDTDEIAPVHYLR